LRGHFQDGLHVFRGVPYAASPIGPLRWQAARRHPGWEGVRDATTYGESAPQPVRESPLIGYHGQPPFGEDCLTLNLWTPGLDDAARPILVWIHGGGFLTGSANLPIYATDTFARDGDIVAVSINYRLGPLGFLAGLGDPNVWLTDQVAALRWIADNAAAFGGDPSRITLAGQSGGGYSIAALAQHPEARGLFQRGILQSAPLGLQLPEPGEALARTRSLAQHLGHDDIEALRGEPWERLIQGTVGVLMEHAGFGEWGLAYYPVLDEATIPRPPIDVVLESSLDLMIGWTGDEATFAFGMDPQYEATTRGEVTTWAAKRHGEQAESLVDTYLALGIHPGDVVAKIVTDDYFRRSGFRVADARAESRPSYVYQFDIASPLKNGRIGATHCLDLPFTFGNIDRWRAAPFVQGLAPDLIRQKTDALHNAWIRFARDGEPQHPGLPSWPRYDAEHPVVLLIGEAIHATEDVPRPPEV
jgi:para-nitrobenzyl esterase